MISPEYSPYTATTVAIDEPRNAVPFSKWVPILGLVFAAPPLALGVFGLDEEFTGGATKPIVSFTFGVSLAVFILFLSAVTFLIPFLASRWFFSAWSTNLMRLMGITLVSSIAFALIVFLFKFDQIEFVANPIRTSALYGIALLSMACICCVPLATYHLMVFSITRWRLKKMLATGPVQLEEA